MCDMFVCDKCDNLDAIEFAYPDGFTPGSPYECTQCQTGQWHGLLTQRQYNPAKDMVVNRPSGVGMDSL